MILPFGYEPLLQLGHGLRPWIGAALENAGRKGILGVFCERCGSPARSGGQILEPHSGWR